MGCDIHSVGQVRNSANHPWRSMVARVAGDHRDYEVFSAFAGVRGEVEPRWAPRGFPDDIVLVEVTRDRRHGLIVGASVRMDPSHVEDREFKDISFVDNGVLWLGEHTFSWLTLDEVEQIAAKYSPRLGYPKDGVKKYVDSLTALAKREDITDKTCVRIVFGFDS